MPPQAAKPKVSAAPHTARVRDADSFVIVLVEVRIAEGRIDFLGLEGCCEQRYGEQQAD